MATATSSDQINEERRKRVFLGTLPPDFLRISESNQLQQESADQQAALALQQQMFGSSFVQNATGRLNITVTNAKLVKNYGMTRMDPYVRIRVGHCVYETHTDPNGGKNPRWNKVIQCLVPQGVTNMTIEIYDECSFTMDELIAWTVVPIPSSVLAGETHEDWYPLTGKQGEGLEGMINLVLSYSNVPVNPYFYPTSGVAPVMMVPSTATGSLYGISPYAPVQVYTQPTPASALQTVAQYNEQDFKQIEEMFPNMDKEVIKSVYEANRFNKNASVNCLLQMAE